MLQRQQCSGSCNAKHQTSFIDNVWKNQPRDPGATVTCSILQDEATQHTGRPKSNWQNPGRNAVHSGNHPPKAIMQIDMFPQDMVSQVDLGRPYCLQILKIIFLLLHLANILNFEVNLWYQHYFPTFWHKKLIWEGLSHLYFCTEYQSEMRD